MIDLLLDRYVYFFVLVLLGIGLYGVLVKRDLTKKIIGLTIFSTAIYLFFIQGAIREDGAAPIIDESLGSNPDAYVDPLPHLLILTAIVVGVGVTGVGLALLVRIYRAYGSLDEIRIAAKIANPDGLPTSAIADPRPHDDPLTRDDLGEPDLGEPDLGEPDLGEPDLGDRGPDERGPDERDLDERDPGGDGE